MSTKQINEGIELTIPKGGDDKVSKTKEDVIEDLSKELLLKNSKGEYGVNYPVANQIVIEVINEVSKDLKLNLNEVWEVLLTTTGNKNTFKELVEKKIISRNGQGREILQNGNNLITIDIVYLQNRKEDEDDVIDNNNKNFYDKLLKDIILKLSILNMMSKKLSPLNNQGKFSKGWKEFYKGHRLGKLFNQFVDSEDKTRLSVAYPTLDWSFDSVGIVDKYFTTERKEIINRIFHDVTRWDNESKTSKKKFKFNFFDSEGDKITPNGFVGTKQIEEWIEFDEYVLVKKTESSEKHLNKMDTQDVYKIGEEIK